MKNTNASVKWLHKKKNISIDERIEDINNPVRGIYGIFIKDKSKRDEKKRCVYVGRSNSIYGRMFDSKNGHVAMIKEKQHFIPELNEASDNENIKVFIKILEEVPLEFDNYYKDMQRLASAENYHINKYQGMDQCLNQVPEGCKMTKEYWKSMKYKNSNKQTSVCGLDREEKRFNFIEEVKVHYPNIDVVKTTLKKIYNFNNGKGCSTEETRKVGVYALFEQDKLRKIGKATDENGIFHRMSQYYRGDKKGGSTKINKENRDKIEVLYFNLPKEECWFAERRLQVIAHDCGEEMSWENTTMN